MIKFGLTGEMGSGKSYCAKLFTQYGVPVFYTDNEAKKVINTNLNLKRDICEEFGNVYDEDGMMIPQLIRNMVYVEGSQDRLNKLNSLVHPYVFEEYNKFCELHKDKKYTLAESAILFESGMDKVVDKTIYVSTDEETRIQRTFKRSGFSRDEYRNRMKSQIPNKEKLVDFVIMNNDNDDVEEQVKEINNIL